MTQKDYDEMEPRGSKTNSRQENDTTVDPLSDDAGTGRTRHPMEVLAGALGLALNKQLLSAREVAGRLGISLAQFFRMNSSGAFGPRPIKFGQKCSRWRAAELEAWVRAGCPLREQWLRVQKDRTWE